VLTDIYVEHTGKDHETLRRDMERDNFMTAQEAANYGLADQILTTRA
jgi:ATP-dependent Clp protease protease subunit